MFFFQLAINRESLTGGAFGLSWIKRILRWHTMVVGLEQFLVLALVFCAIALIGLRLFKRTYFFSILKWRWENDTVLKVLGVQVSRYTLVMILITSLCAVIWWNLFAFYYLYIDPRSFWLSMLILVLVIGFISYKRWELPTFIVALIVIFAYEYLRFFKVVDPSKLGYLREWIFALAIMITSYITFKRTSFGRQQ
jgi:ABC-type branched-subunit amino acid transport system permease subunit